MATPRCPYCNTQGLKNLAIHHADSYSVVYCNQCGAIYGVVPTPQRIAPQGAVSHQAQQKQAPPPIKPPVKPPVKAPSVTASPRIVRTLETPEMPLQHAALSQSDLIRAISNFAGEEVKLTPGQLQHVYRDALDTEIVPKCPDHLLDLVKIVIPPGVKYAGQNLWVCPQYSRCHQWHTNKPPQPDPAHPGLTARDIAQAIADFTRQKVGLTQPQVESLYNMALLASKSPESPNCLKHQQPMVKIVIPTGFKHAGQEIWICSHYTQCRQWITDDDKTLIQKPLAFIAEIGNSDLVKDIPSLPLKMAAMAQVSRTQTKGTAYRKFIIDNGPPSCWRHETEMQQLTIPQGYKNQGVTVWVCPKFDCKEWNLADG